MTAETVDTTPTDESENADWNGPLRSADDVKKRVRSVIRLRQKKDSAAVAARAHLRSAAGREVGDVPAIWSYTLDSGSEKELAHAVGPAPRIERCSHEQHMETRTHHRRFRSQTGVLRHGRS